MKYYTEQDVADMVAYMAGWTLGCSRRKEPVTGKIVVEEMKKQFKPRDIKDLLEKPVKK